MTSSNFDAVAELNSVLADRTTPLLVRLDESSCIVAAHFSYDSKHMMGIVFRHPEGLIDIGTSPPGDPDENWEESVDSNLCDGLPGLAIVRQLTALEASEVGLQFADFGGPASSAPMIEFRGELHELQGILTKKGLPVDLHRIVTRYLH